MGADGDLHMCGGDVAGGQRRPDRGQVPHLGAQQPRPPPVPPRRPAPLPQDVMGEHGAGVPDLRLGDDIVPGVHRRQHPQTPGADLGGEPLPQLTQRAHLLGGESRMPQRGQVGQPMRHRARGFRGCRRQ